MGILERVAKYHKDWIELAAVFDKDFAEDIVQEMYLLLHKYNVSEEQMFTNGRINRGYVFIIIRNIHFQLHNIRKRINKVELNDEVYRLEDDFNLDAELDWNKFRNQVEEITEKWDWYDKKLFTLYKDNKTSIRKLAKETGISFVSIFHTLKDCKKRIKNELNEDYNNLKL